MKNLIIVLFILIIYNLTFNIENCEGQWIHQSGVTTNNISQTAENTIYFKSILDKEWPFTQNRINENIEFHFYNPADSIKSNEQDSNITKSNEPVLKTDSIISKEKDTIITKINKPVLIIDSIKSKEQDSNITKIVKPIIKKDTVKIIEKIPHALNAITFQPIGLFLFFTNFEYDRAVTNSLALGGKITFTTLLLRSSLEKMVKKEKDKKPISTLSSFGMGFNFRYFPGNRAVEGFFLGGAIEGLAITFDEIKENKSYDSLTYQTTTTSTINHRKLTLTRIEFEIGARTKISSGTEGFIIQWTLGAGVGYWNDGQKNGAIPLGSIGFGIGYAF
ncbi:MAG: hypothetical protein NTU73_09670 [Ignavibacteriae bacterium]|nr:hypothetical protein [Ignavibacteriota bacterium]